MPNAGNPAPAPTILVVDDDQGLSILVEKVLQREGFEKVYDLAARSIPDALPNSGASVISTGNNHQPISTETTISMACPISRITGCGDMRLSQLAVFTMWWH